MVAALALASSLSACAPPVGEYDTAEAIFDAAGGEGWCDGPLRMTLAPWVGGCGAMDSPDRVAIAIAIDQGELLDSVNRADGDQLVLVPENPLTLPGFQLRSSDRDKLEAAQAVIGGVILDGREAIDAWLR